jgi:hypothetical protein
MLVLTVIIVAENIVVIIITDDIVFVVYTGIKIRTCIIYKC